MKKFACFVLILVLSAGLGLLFRGVSSLKKKPEGLKVESDEEVIFCGERVPMERPEVKKRFSAILNAEIERYSSKGLDSLRNNLWFSFVESELKTAGLPSDLKYLPIIESDLNCLAKSEKGARGLWQFMATTAHRFGLRVDKYVDERCDPFASTNAAKDYLDFLYSKFLRWSDVFAGYNMGEDDFEKIKNTEGAADFYAVQGIPAETKEFIFRVIATKLIFENPEKYEILEQSFSQVETWRVQKIKLTIKKKQESITGIIVKLKSRYPDLDREQFDAFNFHLSQNLPAGIYNVYIRDKNGTS